MKTYTKEALNEYMKNDWIYKLLLDNTQDNKTRYDEWLFEIEAKRLIYADIYGDILMQSCENKKVLDVGGGISAMTPLLAANCNYTLVDFLAHGGKEMNGLTMNWKNMDWYDFEIQDVYDIVIANDIFPDVDQRLEMFIDKFLPHCNELRLVMTYYNTAKFYLTKRCDDPELMTFLSWDGEITALKMMKYLSCAINTTKEELASMKYEKNSIYRNGRQVSYIALRGKS